MKPSHAKLTDDQQSLCESYIPLARKFARLWVKKHPGVDFDDVLSWCFMGLVMAARKHQPGADYFSVRARSWMLSRCEYNYSRRHMIAIPLKSPEGFNKIPSIRMTHYRDLRDLPADIRKDQVESDVAIESAVSDAIDALPVNQRKVILKRYFADEDVTHIAKSQGITRQSVHRCLSIAHGSLSEALGEKLGFAD